MSIINIANQHKNNLFNKIDEVTEYSKNMASKIIHDAITDGAKIKIVHERYVSDSKVASDDLARVRSAIRLAASRREKDRIEKDITNLGIRLERNSKSGEFHRHNFVYPFGGRTILTITEKNGEVLEAVADCSIVDNFNRRDGISVCLDKIIAKKEEEFYTKISQ